MESAAFPYLDKLLGHSFYARFVLGRKIDDPSSVCNVWSKRILQRLGDCIETQIKEM